MHDRRPGNLAHLERLINTWSRETGDGGRLDRDLGEAGSTEQLAGALYAPHRAEPVTVAGERHRHAVHA